MSESQQSLGHGPETTESSAVAPFDRYIWELNDKDGEFMEQAAELAPLIWEDSVNLIENAENVFEHPMKGYKEARLRASYRGYNINVSLRFQERTNSLFKSLIVLVDDEDIARVDKKGDETATPYRLTYGDMNYTYRGVVEARTVLDYIKQNPEPSKP